jgi:hypothetical protein
VQPTLSAIATNGPCGGLRPKEYPMSITLALSTGADRVIADAHRLVPANFGSIPAEIRTSGTAGLWAHRTYDDAVRAATNPPKRTSNGLGRRGSRRMAARTSAA